MADDRLECVLPVKALLMTLLTTERPPGILVLVFEEGNLGQDCRVTKPRGSTTDFRVLVAIVFGLSTDYGVFLPRRDRKEAHDGGRPTRTQSLSACNEYGAIVTAAAIFLAVALGALVTSQSCVPQGARHWRGRRTDRRIVVRAVPP